MTESEVVLFAGFWTLAFVVMPVFIYATVSGLKLLARNLKLSDNEPYKVIRHLYDCWKLYQLGYYMSSNTHESSSGRWGFVRLNFERGESRAYAIMDIDFRCGAFSQVSIGDKHFHRWDVDEQQPEIKFDY